MQLARAFLDGVDDLPLEALRCDMEQAAERLEFERAAALRDKLRRLEGLREQFLHFRFAVESLSFVYTVPGHAGEDRSYVIRRGRIRAEMPAPATALDAAELATAASDVFGRVEHGGAQIPTHEIDELLLLSSWFRKYPEELDRADRDWTRLDGTGVAGVMPGRVAALAKASSARGVESGRLAWTRNRGTAVNQSPCGGHGSRQLPWTRNRGCRGHGIAVTAGGHGIAATAVDTESR